MTPGAVSNGPGFFSCAALVIGVLLFSALPAGAVGWLLYRSDMQGAQALSQKTIEDVARQAKTAAEGQLAQAHVVLNSLMADKPDAFTDARARQLIQKPELFEQAAFAMARMTPDVPRVFMGTQQGAYLSVETFLRGRADLTRVSERKPGSEARSVFWAAFPGDRQQVMPAEATSYEPRVRPWYRAAQAAGARVFTPVVVSPTERQLLMALVQPVYDADGTALGVFAVDLPLKRLGELLQGLRVSTHGAVYLVDEQGYLLASSTGEELVSGMSGSFQRHRPQQSRNAQVRGADAGLQATARDNAAAGLKPESFLRRLALGNDSLLVARQSLGESMGLRWHLVVAAPESDFTGPAEAALRQALAAAALVLALGALLSAVLLWRLRARFRPSGGAGAALVLPQPGHGVSGQALQLPPPAPERAQAPQPGAAANEAEILALHQARQLLEAKVASLGDELSASRQEVEGLAQAKTAFLAAMSHEIRTPLNGVVGMTTLLADTALDLEQRDYVHTMRVSSDHLLAVINDILDFSKIESGRLDLENEPFNLMAAIEEACDIAAPRAREKGLELLLDLDGGLPAWVHGDAARLRQVLLNLVNNAVKFTERGQVIVSAEMLEAWGANHGALVEFRVRDTGIGIARERQQALFQSFVQVDGSTTRKYGGSGLGLAICKRLVKLMGGRVGLESAPGEGSTFWFTARLGQADVPELASLSSLHLVSLAGKRAAVVDDTLVNLRILDRQLRRWGMAPMLFERGADALDWLAQHPVDVVLTDMHMPEMDGQSLAATLRKRMPALPIVLLTSGILPAGAQGRVFDARLLKPYRQAQLFETLARVMSAPEADKSRAGDSSLNASGQFVLVADDNAINLKVALAMLAKLGYEAATAVNGSEAVERVAASMRTGTGATAREGPRRYAAILMDANMPVMDGFAASRLIIRNHGALAPPIIALTAAVLEEDRQRCREAGMVGFLPKPLRIDELAEALALHARQPEAENTIKMIANGADATSAGGVNDAESVLMDWSRLEQFREFDDEALSMTREVITLFTSEMPQRIDDIRVALAASDSALLSRAAHALKGSASNVGARVLSQVCGHLEQSCLQGQWPADATAQVAGAIGLADKTCEALKSWASQAAVAPDA
ncbi:MAG: multi-sensor hybrid histidine kinase [Polaromonas sp.]|nr:multi-sensor hybrid histidine kinase [Polaromonas sp.]